MLKGKNRSEVTKDALPRLDDEKVPDVVVSQMVKHFGALSDSTFSEELKRAVDYLTVDLAEIERRYLRGHPDTLLSVDAERLRLKRVFVPPLLEKHVERRLVGELIQVVTARMEDRQPRWRVVILYGVGGIGKTELAKAVAYSEDVVAIFPGGIFWIDASWGGAEQWAERLCEAIGRKKKGRERWTDCWRRWAGEPDRRILLLVDDAVEEDELGLLSTTPGPQAAMIVTTQDAHRMRMGMASRMSGSKICEMGVRGMEPQEGLRLVERVIERPLHADEREMVQEIGEQVGWHPEELFSAALDGRDMGWDKVLKVAESGPLSKRRLERQLKQMEGQERGWLEALVHWMKRGGIFGSLYGAAVWNMEIEKAERQLRRFEGMGLVEQLEGQRDMLWPEEQLWQVTPVVYKELGPEEPKGVVTRAIEAMHRDRLAKRVYEYDRPIPRVPHSFQLIGTFWWIGALPKSLVSGVLRIVEWGIGDRGWRRRWDDSTILMAAERHLKSRLREAGIEPPAEFWLIYDSQDVTAAILFVSEITLVVGWMVLSTLISLWLYGDTVSPRWIRMGDILVLIGALGLYLAICWQVTWRVWMAHLYGVETWDLQLILKLARRSEMKAPNSPEGGGNGRT